MIIKLTNACASNWLLIADQLNDPEGWSRFVPCHPVDSDRSRFESLVAETAAYYVKLKACKHLLMRGRSAFEYDWEMEEETILGHAMEVAARLGIDLEIGDETSKSVLSERTVA